ncbi:MAG: hypothetical protein J0M34_02580 [Alphaproteobacteria bacterium]|nr:hypothetical protein [Alphaproteobacteria bacterium]
MSEIHNSTKAQRREEERKKSQLQKAEDIAYTINHALSCMTTDTLIQPFTTAAAGAFFDKKLNIGCTAHDHGAHRHVHEVVNPSFGQRFSHFTKQVARKEFWLEAKHWFKGEVYGDVGAVIPTILIQRYAPNVMNDVRNLLEPALGWAFKMGAHDAAKQWAKKNFVSEDSEAFKQKQQQIYEHEVSHLPQAFMWNVFSFPIGMAGQYHELRQEVIKGVLAADKLDLWKIGKQKAIGALISNGLLIGGRALAPGAFIEWDRFNSQNIIIPTTKVIGSTIGIDSETVDKVAKKQEEMGGHHHFTERLAAEEKSTPALLQP